MNILVIAALLASVIVLGGGIATAEAQNVPVASGDTAMASEGNGSLAVITVDGVSNDGMTLTWTDGPSCTDEEATMLGVGSAVGCSGILYKVYDPAGRLADSGEHANAAGSAMLDHGSGGPGTYILQITSRLAQGDDRMLPASNMYHSYTVPGPSGGAGTPQQRLDAQVIHDNDPPSFALTAVTYETVAGQKVTVPLRANDPNGDGLEFGIVGGKGSIEGSNFVWTPAAADIGAVNNVRLQVHDGKLGITATDIYITVKSSPLLLRVDGDRTLLRGETFRLQMNATDSDNDQSTWRYTLADEPAGMVVHGNGTIIWKPSSDQGLGRYHFTATVSHPDDSTSVRVTLTIESSFREPPSLPRLEPNILVERITVSGETVGYVMLDHFDHHHRPTFMAYMLRDGTYSWVLLDNTGATIKKDGTQHAGSFGTFVWPPVSGPVAEFGYNVDGAEVRVNTKYILRISDSDGNRIHDYTYRTRAANVEEIPSLNEPATKYYMPQADLDPARDGAYYTLFFREAGVYKLGVSASGGTNATMINGTEVTVTSEGTLDTYTSRVTGLDSESTYYFHMTQAGSDFGAADQAIEPFRTAHPSTTTAGAADDVFAVDGMSTTVLNVTANDNIYPPDQAGLTFNIHGTPRYGNATFEGRNIVYSTDVNEDVTDTITYWLGNRFVTSFADSNESGWAANVTVSILSRYINQPPTAQNDTTLTAIPGRAVYEYLGDDVSDPERGPLRMEITEQGDKGMAGIIAESDTLVYTANINAEGADTVRYTVTDDHNLTATGTVNVQIIPLEDNVAPTAANFEISIASDDTSFVNLTRSGLIRDGNGDPLNITITRQPHIGVAEAAGDAIRYLPADGTDGQTTNFTYSVSDGRGGTAGGTVVVNIGVTEEVVFVAVDDRRTVTQGVPSVINVTDNDTIEPPTAVFELAVIRQPMQGNATVTPDGRAIRYTSDATATGSDNFVYALRAGGTSNAINATVTIEIETANSPPTATDFAVSAMRGNTTRVNLAEQNRISDPDQEAGTLNVRISRNATNGQTVLVDTVIFYTPGAGAPANDTIGYTVRDGAGLEDTGVITINITGMAPAPPTAALTLQDVPDQTVAAHSTLRVDIVAQNATGSVGFELDPPVAGVHLNPATGHLVWVPTASETGVLPLNVRAADRAGSDSVAFNVTVEAPVATVGNIVRNSDTENRLEYTAGSSDVNATFKSLFVGTEEAHSEPETLAAGQSSTALIGTYERPHPRDGTTYYAEIVEESGSPGSDENVYAQFTIGRDGFVIIPNPNTNPAGIPNAPPVASGFTINPVPSETVRVDLVEEGHIRDANQDARTLLAVIADSPAPAQGVASISDSVITYRANDNAAGNDSVSYTVTDGAGRSSTGVMTVEIEAPDVPDPEPIPDPAPVPPTTITVPNLQRNIQLGTFITIVPDINASLTITNATGATLGDIDTSRLSSGTILYQAGLVVGTDTITYTVSDGAGGTGNGTITIYINERNNTAPVLDSIGDKSIEAGRNLVFAVTANDTDGDPLTYGLDNAPDGAEIDPNTGEFSWMPGPAQNGTYTITITVRDAGNAVDSETLTIVVTAPDAGGPNQDPAAPDILINAELFFPSAVTPAVTDPDGDDITITHVSEPTLGILDDSMLPQISYTPNQTGIERLNYTATDSKMGTDTGTITIFINPDGNARPELDHIYNTGGRVGVDLEFAATAEDSDDTSLTFDIANAPDGAGITAGGDFSWRPAESQNGTHTVTFIVYDDSGGADWQHVTINVLRADETNLPPVPQDIEATVVLGGGRGFQPDIVDPEGDMTEITRVYDSSLGDVDRSFTSQGIIVYVAGVLGDDEVIYTVSDGRGGFTNGTISITVEEPANVRPLIDFVGDKSVNAGDELTFTVDADDLDGLVVDFGLEGATQGPSMSPLGVFSWTPTANDEGQHEFTILVFDDAGDNSTVTITVTVRPEGYRNSPPVAPDVVIMTPQDVLSIVRPTLTDPDEGDPVRISGTGQTTKGSILSGFLRAGIIIYLPNQGESGTETIPYTIADSSDDTDTATINVFISARGNTDPILGSIDFRNINAGDPLAFDLEAEDPDGDTISYLPVGAPDGIEISPEGAFSWTPAATDVGNHTFTIIAYDDRGGADSKTAVIRVLPAGTANRAPDAPDSTVTVAAGGSIVITPAISDPDGDRVVIADAVASGTGVVIQSEDSINYIHVATTPTETITYTVQDSRGSESTGTITITVQ